MRTHPIAWRRGYVLGTHASKMLCCEGGLMLRYSVVRR